MSSNLLNPCLICKNDIPNCFWIQIRQLYRVQWCFNHHVMKPKPGDGKSPIACFTFSQAILAKLALKIPAHCRVQVLDNPELPVWMCWGNTKYLRCTLKLMANAKGTFNYIEGTWGFRFEIGRAFGSGRREHHPAVCDRVFAKFRGPTLDWSLRN